MQNNTIRKIISKINEGRRFLITAHVNLEGDALGTELATYILLKKLKKDATIYNHDVTPQIYNFLPFSRVIKNSLDRDSFDAAIVLDCSDSSRAGKVKDALTKCKNIINIDHHISNTYFGDLNWVDSQAGSTAQLIYRLCERFKIMDKNIALCLYTGIFTDTGNFTYSNTDYKIHEIVSRLMKYNIHPNKIYDNIHSLCTHNDLNFIGKIMSSLKFDSSGKICWAAITEWKDKNYDLTEVIFSIMRLLKGVEVFLLFKKVDKNKTRINFRSRHRVDVNKIAKFFGGGGHKRASGTTVDESIPNAERKVISFIKRYTNGQQRKSSRI